MIESIKVLGDGAQITLIICSTIVVLSVLVLITGLIYCLCRCHKKKNQDENNSSGSPQADAKAKTVESQEGHSLKLQFEKEDRAKALIKDLFEATRVKTTDSNNKKEEKCDIEVAKKLIQEYKSILNSMNEGQSN